MTFALALEGVFHKLQIALFDAHLQLQKVLGIRFRYHINILLGRLRDKPTKNFLHYDAR